MSSIRLIIQKDFNISTDKCLRFKPNYQFFYQIFRFPLFNQTKCYSFEFDFSTRISISKKTAYV